MRKPNWIDQFLLDVCQELSCRGFYATCKLEPGPSAPLTGRTLKIEGIFPPVLLIFRVLVIEEPSRSRKARKRRKDCISHLAVNFWVQHVTGTYPVPLRDALRVAPKGKASEKPRLVQLNPAKTATAIERILTRKFGLQRSSKVWSPRLKRPYVPAGGS